MKANRLYIIEGIGAEEVANTTVQGISEYPECGDGCERHGAIETQ
jgi:hypothetical protein